MKEQLFNKFIYSGIRTQTAEKLIRTLLKKGFVERANVPEHIPERDFRDILDDYDISLAEYSLLLRFIKNQPVNYKEAQVQEYILKHVSLSQFALMDENCPKELKDKIPSNIRAIKPPANMIDFIQLNENSEFDWEDELGEDENIEIASLPIYNDEEFLKKKEECREQIENGFIAGEGIYGGYERIMNKCLKICNHTDDKQYKKALYAQMNQFQLSNRIAYNTAYSLRHEKDPEILSYVFENCPTLLMQKTEYEHDSSILLRISNNPAITKDVALQLTKHFQPEEYCQNKFCLAVAELLLKNEAFPEGAYEYYATNNYFDKNYRNKNAHIIQEHLLYDPHTPPHIITKMAEQRSRLKLIAQIRAGTGLCGKELESIHHAITSKNFKTLYELEKETKAKLLLVLAQSDFREIGAYDAMVVLSLDNPTNMPYNPISIGEQIGCLTNRDYFYDPLICYYTIKEYEKSEAFKIVTAEREYIAFKEAQKAEKAQATQSTADNILSDEPEKVDITSKTSTEEITL